jgi:hypothetical protein
MLGLRDRIPMSATQSPAGCKLSSPKQARQAEATSVYWRSTADYARAITRLHHAKGTAITRHGYRITL